MSRPVEYLTRDVDEAARVCDDVYFPHRMTLLHGEESFAMCLRAVDLGAVAVGLLTYAGPVRLSTGLLETGYQVNVPLTGELTTSSGDRRVEADRSTAAVYRPDATSVLDGWVDGGTVLGVKIERTALESCLQGLLGGPIGTIPVAASLDLSRGAGRQWWVLASALVEMLRSPEGLLRHPAVGASIAQGLVHGFLHAVDHPWRSELEPAGPPRPAAVQRAVDLIEADPARLWQLAELAHECGASVRALQEGFARHVGMPPSHYLRAARLRRVRADLVAADPTEQTVSDIAMRWGFLHLGRFAAAYRREYGELPSATLHH